jgi:molybdopterin converting factor small subunit
MNTNVWQITEFADKITEGLEGSVHYNTVDKWFKELEKRRIHYINRVAGEKIYDEMDLRIGRFIYQKRLEKWRLDVIFEYLPEALEVRPFPDEWGDNNDIITDPSQLEKKILQAVMTQLQEEIGKAKLELLHSVKEVAVTQITSMLPKPKDDAQERLERMNMIITQKRVEMALEEEAIKLWNQKPEHERMKKVGWFRKEEDLIKRHEFIRQYIRENMERALKEALEIENT